MTDGRLSAPLDRAVAFASFFVPSFFLCQPENTLLPSLISEIRMAMADVFFESEFGLELLRALSTVKLFLIR